MCFRIEKIDVFEFKNQNFIQIDTRYFQIVAIHQDCASI